MISNELSDKLIRRLTNSYSNIILIISHQPKAEGVEPTPCALAFLFVSLFFRATEYGFHIFSVTYGVCCRNPGNKPLSSVDSHPCIFGSVAKFVRLGDNCQL
jgi:hypothetical protein